MDLLCFPLGRREGSIHSFQDGLELPWLLPVKVKVAPLMTGSRTGAHFGGEPATVGRSCGH